MTIIITDDHVKRYLPMQDCIDAMRVAFKDFSEKTAVNPPRMRYAADHPDPVRKYLANVHLGAVPSSGIACVRAGSQIIIPPSATNKRRLYENPRPFNWGIVILYDIETAEPLALMHEFYLSGIRVGATSALAVDEIARPDASVLGLFGTGKQASAAIEAAKCVRPIKQVNIFSPNTEHCNRFAQEKSTDQLEVTPVSRPAEVVEKADIIYCATTSMEPVFDGQWLEAGQLVITIANSDATNRKRSEVDETTYSRSSAVVVNDWKTVVDDEQTELLEPLEKGLITRKQVMELGDIVAGKTHVKQAGRGDPDGEIIYYKNNTGLAIQFAAVGGMLYRKTLEKGDYNSIPTEWLGSDLSAFYEAGFRPSP
jgi:ornithine cyclodeaminase/alanine dehydrogenase-like protein (mu-crystallin family)